MKRFLSVLFLIATSCDNSEPYCEEETVLLADLDVSSAGLTGAELKAGLTPQAAAPLIWADGEVSTLAWDFAIAMDTLEDVIATPVYPPLSRSEVLLECLCYTTMLGLLELQSTDGMIDTEIWVSVAWYGIEPGGADFSEKIASEDLGGSFDLSEYIDVSAYDLAELWVSGTITDGYLDGELCVHTEQINGDVIEVGHTSIATFGTQEE